MAYQRLGSIRSVTWLLALAGSAELAGLSSCSGDETATAQPPLVGAMGGAGAAGGMGGVSGGGSSSGGAPSCADRGGTPCASDQFCTGAWLDTDCCDGPCEPIPTCNGEPMVKPPRGFPSIDVYEIRPNHDALRIQEAARLVGDARVARVKRPLLWHQVEPAVNDGWDEGVLATYDALFQAFADEGVEVEIELVGTPRWASSCPGDPPIPNLDCNDVQVAAGFPPTDLDDWRDFVQTMVDRYDHITNRWAIWAEPDRGDMWRGTAAEYVAHLNAAVEIIRVWDADAEVLAPQMNVGSWVFGLFWEDTTNNRWRDWIETVARDGHQDVFSIHILLDETVEDIVDSFEQTREKLDGLGKQAMPLAVTSTQVLGAFPAAPGAPRDLQCPYVDTNSYEALSEDEQAATFTEIYACLANAGAQAVSWYRLSDLDANGWLIPCPATNCTCDDTSNPPVDACRCGSPDPVHCNFWCPPDGIDRSGILAPYDATLPEGQRYRTKAAYEAAQRIGRYAISP